MKSGTFPLFCSGDSRFPTLEPCCLCFFFSPMLSIVVTLYGRLYRVLGHLYLIRGIKLSLSCFCCSWLYCPLRALLWGIVRFCAFSHKRVPILNILDRASSSRWFSSNYPIALVRVVSPNPNLSRCSTSGSRTVQQGGFSVVFGSVGVAAVRCLLR